MPTTIVAIGEALWDLFPEERRPGGAPCNVAYHAAQLGHRGVIVSRVGRDRPGDELVSFLETRGVETAFVQRDGAHPTGTVTITGDRADPHYTIADDVAWDHLSVDDQTRGVVRSAAAVCVGSLAQRHEASRDAIRKLLSAARGHAMIVFDVNLRPPFVDVDTIRATFEVADVVKMDRQEEDRLSRLLNQPDLVTWLVGRGVRVVCITRGEDGASVTTSRETHSVPGVRVDASGGDAVGAGDAFTAALTHQLIHDVEPAQALAAANRYAALVAGRAGAMPPISAADLKRIRG